MGRQFHPVDGVGWKGGFVKSVQSVTCLDCTTKYRTMFKKGGKVPARLCPKCNSDRYTINPVVRERDGAASNF